MNHLVFFSRLATLGLALSVCHSASGAPFSNGSFESSTFASTASRNLLNTAGDTRITGWNFRNPGGSDAYYTFAGDFVPSAGAGTFHLLFGGSQTSGDILEQNFDTVIGTTYQVQFQTTLTQFTNLGVPPAQSVRVDFLDSTLSLLSGGGTQNILSQINGVWLQSSVFSFTATSTNSWLRFTDTSVASVANPVNWGLDDVRLTALPPATSGVPEPSTLAVAASALAVLGAYRKFGRSKQ